MKEIINKILNVDKKVLIFLIIISIIGIITGSIFITVLNENDKNTIYESLNTFLAEYGHLNNKFSLFNNLVLNNMYTLLIWILGISIIGLPIVILIIFFKSFLISFTISSFIMKYKTKGIILGIIYNIPHLIINLLVYLYLGVYSIKFSLNIIDMLFNKRNIDMKKTFSRYSVVLLFSFIMIILTSLYETYLMPIILKKVLKII